MSESDAAKACRVDAGAGFAINYLETAAWRDAGLRAFLHYRDLGVAEATGGRVRAEHIRATGPVEGGTGWHCHDLEFQFVYVLAGFVEFTAAGHGEVRLEAGDCAHIPPFTMHDETAFSEDFEVLEVTMPAAVETLTKPPADAGAGSSRFVADHLGPDSFVRGEGPRRSWNIAISASPTPPTGGSKRRSYAPTAPSMPAPVGTITSSTSSLSTCSAAGCGPNSTAMAKL